MMNQSPRTAGSPKPTAAASTLMPPRISQRADVFARTMPAPFTDSPGCSPTQIAVDSVDRTSAVDDGESERSSVSQADVTVRRLQMLDDNPFGGAHKAIEVSVGSSAEPYPGATISSAMSSI